MGGILWPVDGKSAILLLLAASGAVLVANAVYSLVVHPLSSVPGPRLCATTRFPYWIRVFRGRDVQYMHQLHERYGPVVRYGPNDLSFSSAQSWRDIHGHNKGRPAPPKAEDFGMQPANGVQSIIMCDDENHARVRRIFAPAFADRALRQQEPLFKKYVDLLIQRVEQAISKSANVACVEMTRYLNFTTFDIMAELCFAHPLGLLENSEFSPWVFAIFEMIGLLPVSMFIEYYPALSKLFKRFEPKWVRDTKSDHFRHSADRVDRRLKESTDLPDFWNLVVTKDMAEGGLSLDEMHSNSELFMLAGTETTATLLSGLLYFLCRDPAKLRLLVDEIRGTHKTVEEMTLDSLMRLPYLNACIKEGLRVYPPVPAGAPRVVGHGGLSVAGQWCPEGTRVTVCQYAAFHSKANFADADAFAPERWLPAGHAASDRSGRFERDQVEACQPFAMGARGCLGQNMALHESRLILAALLLRFDFGMGEGSEGWVDQKAHALWVKKPLFCNVTVAGH